VKQAIAKEGIVPSAKFFAQTKNLSFGRLTYWIRSDRHMFITKNLDWLLRQRWMDPLQHSQETPVGALFIHWLFTIIMILVTIRLNPIDAYGIVVNIYSYTVVAVLGFAIAMGMLKLRFSSRERWRQKSTFNPYISVASAFILAIGSAYPIVASWIPPKQTRLAIPWFTAPTAAWSILCFGLVWYVGFNLYASRLLRKYGLEFQVQKMPMLENDPQPDGPPVQIHETVYLAWVAKEYAGHPETEIGEHRRSRESF
jgi:hypothetical protein